MDFGKSLNYTKTKTMIRGIKMKNLDLMLKNIITLALLVLICGTVLATVFDGINVMSAYSIDIMNRGLGGEK